MVVPSADGPETRMQLSAGENGFLVATAADGRTHETDQSNCLLVAIEEGSSKKRPAAAKAKGGPAKKRPAAALKRPAAASATDDEDEEYVEEEESNEGEEEEEAEVSEAGAAVLARPAAAAALLARPAAAAAVLTRPAAAAEEGGWAVQGRTYALEWYKKDGRVGVKLKHGKRNQLCSFGGAVGKNEGLKSS